MIDIETITLAARTVVQQGIELPFSEQLSLGHEYPDWANNPTGDRNGAMKYQEPKILHQAGTVFIKSSVLEALKEADNSWGMGDAFLLGHFEGIALEEAGLATRETKGGYHSRPEQKVALEALLDRISLAQHGEQLSKLGATP